MRAKQGITQAPSCSKVCRVNKRVVIAGFGDTGLLVAIHLGSQFEIVGISPKPCLVSGQELGTRLTWPEVWKRDYLTGFGRYKKLDGVRIVQGWISEIDPNEQQVRVRLPDGREQVEAYDALVLSSGATNGFWRNDAFESLAEITDGIAEAAGQVAEAGEIAIVGGGATGVSAAANLAERYPEKIVHLYYSHDQPLPGYHPKVRDRLEAHLKRAGVELHPDHRAVIPEGFACDRLTRDPIEWSTGQPARKPDLTLWAVGRVRPNTAFVPAEMLDESGFVRVDEMLRVPGHANVFAVGDVAASDPNRSSARNWGYRLVAHNLRCHLEGDDRRMKRYEAPAYRWGSILGVQKNGMQVFQANGGRFRFPRWAVECLLFPIAVRRVIYRGMRRGGGSRGTGR
jgi:NADH dehydrogenase FAD-containing subunit